MNVEQETRQNTKDIASLAATVGKLATVFEYSEKAHEKDRRNLEAITAELRTLNDKLTGMNGVQKEIGTLMGEVGKLRHDIKNMEQPLAAIPLIKEALAGADKKSSDHEIRIDFLEKWKERSDGATGAVKIIIHMLWAFVAAGGLSFIAWMAGLFNSGGRHIGGE